MMSVVADHNTRTQPEHGILLSTGEAAKLCSVKPDTVLKWIKKGRVKARRTPGGHYRIEEQDLALHTPRRAHPQGSPAPLPGEGLSRPWRCWEYLSHRGEIRTECRDCIVYRVRAAWCFELAGLTQEIGHAKQFCGTTCEECAYYRVVTGRPIEALIVTADDQLIASLAGEAAEAVSLRFARNGYETSTLIGEFRPAFVIVDEEVITGGEPGLLDCLACDRRVPGLKIILAAERGASPLSGRKDILSVIERPFDQARIAATVRSLPVEPLERASKDNTNGGS